jgi:hypothetical protein
MDQLKQVIKHCFQQGASFENAVERQLPVFPPSCQTTTQHFGFCFAPVGLSTLIRIFLVGSAGLFQTPFLATSSEHKVRNI